MLAKHRIYFFMSIKIHVSTSIDQLRCFKILQGNYNVILFHTKDLFHLLFIQIIPTISY